MYRYPLPLPTYNIPSADSPSAFLRPSTRHFLAMAMVAYFGVSLRKGAVTAFSFATFASRATGSRTSSTLVPALARPAFTARSQCLAMSSSTLEVSADLEKAMDVEHPAYEVIRKDFVSEYGAATTLYRHKKSGAELLSVSNDDDNKVFGITFRTPP